MRKRYIFGAGFAATALVAASFVGVAYNGFTHAQRAGLELDAASAPQRALLTKALGLFHDCKAKSSHGEGAEASSDISAFTECFAPFATVANPKSMAPAMLLLSVLPADPQALATHEALVPALTAAARDGFDNEIGANAQFDAAMAHYCSNWVSAWGCRRALPSVYAPTPNGGWVYVRRVEAPAQAANELDVALWQSAHPTQAGVYGAKLMIARLRPGPALDALAANPPWTADLLPLQKERAKRIESQIQEDARKL